MPKDKLKPFVIAVLIFTLTAVAVAGCGTQNSSTDTSSVTTSDEVSSEVSSETSSVPVSSTPVSSTSSVVSTVDPNHPYYDVIMAIKGIDRTRHGFSFGLQVDENNRPINAMREQEKYKKYGLVCLTDDPMTIYLTFNLEYETRYTPSVLDTLKEKGVTATFFISQNYAENNPAIVRRIIDEGHVLASHGARHKDMALCSPEEVCEEIMNLHNYVKDKFGYEMNLFRPPSGVYSEALFAQAQLLGYKNVEWSFAYEDWDTGKVFNEQGYFEYITGKTHEGAIYSFHTTASITPILLDDIIDYWVDNGYTVKSYQ